MHFYYSMPTPGAELIRAAQLCAWGCGPPLHCVLAHLACCRASQAEFLPCLEHLVVIGWACTGDQDALAVAIGYMQDVGVQVHSEIAWHDEQGPACPRPSCEPE